MYSLLLAIIYLAFISLGLPDSLLGSGWTVMRTELAVPISYAGIITMLISVFTIISSLLSNRITIKIGAGLYTAISVAVSALSLLGFSLCGRFYQLCLCSVPYGLAAGGIDATLNNYVALHYKSNHMSWLHCFWGVGALISPYVMGYCLTGGHGWNSGYRIVFYIQIALAAVMFISLPLWRQHKKPNQDSQLQEDVPEKPLTILQTLKIKGVPSVMIAFFAYCALEQTGMVWASSYLSGFRGVTPEKAASYGAMVYIGLTAGRAASGFVVNKIGDKNLIRIGCGIMATGIGIVAIPVQNTYLALVGLMLFGIGCAPVYPCIVHATPVRFGRERSRSIIGIQMAFAYLGITCMPPLFGILAQYVSIGLYPWVIAAFTVMLVFFNERANRAVQVE